MRRSGKWILTLLVFCLLVGGIAVPQTVMVAAGGNVVYAILFYSPTCPHCHEVMTNVLPQLREQYGEQLVIAEVDTSTAEGGAVWQAAVTRYNPSVVGVPTLVIGDKVLVGSMEIPQKLPGYIDAYLAEGGVPWPDLPGIDAVADDAAPVAPLTFWEQLKERYTRDLAGNVLSTIVLVGLLATIGAIAQPRDWQLPVSRRFGAWGVLTLIAVGLIAAGYLSYIETTGIEAVCGPVGDCNAVQQSEYALLFGFLPMAALGVIGYVGILVVHVYAALEAGAGKQLALAVGFLMSVFGLVFSTYLTFLEPFVIGATCAWCLTSAVCMALIALLSAGPGWVALKRVGRDLGLVKT